MAISPRCADDAAWPLALRYDLQLQLRKVRAEYAERALKLERELSVGRYDLARLPANKRRSAAKRTSRRMRRCESSSGMAGIWN